jgi:hypothetical protein
LSGSGYFPPARDSRFELGAGNVHSGPFAVQRSAWTNYISPGTVSMVLQWFGSDQTTCSPGGCTGIDYGVNFRISAIVTLRYTYLPFKITEFRMQTNGQAKLSWNGWPATNYAVEFKDAIDGPLWADATNIVATGSNVTATVPTEELRKRFYRIRKGVP